MIRAATNEDVSRIYEIYCDRFNQSSAEDCRYQPNSFSLYIDSHHVEILVYEKDGSVVGFVLTYDMVDWGFIEVIAVDKDHRRRGIAAALVKQVVSNPKPLWFVVESCYHLTDDVMEDFFDKLGFVPSQQRTEWVFKLP